MPLRLVPLSGTLAGHARVLEPGKAVVLGRDPTLAEVVFGAEDRLVSRRHASVVERDGVLLLRDLDSSTGTFVDGEDIEEAELVPGDTFELGRGGPRIRVEAGEEGTVVVDVQALPKAALPIARAPREEEAPPAPGAQLRLTFQSGPQAGLSKEPGGSVVRLGRAPTNALAFPQERIVSAQHAKIVRLPDGFVLMDLESTNGTFLNGERVERARIRTRDVIMLGPGGPCVEVELVAPQDAAGGTVVIPNFSELARKHSAAMPLRTVDLPDGASLVVGRSEDAGVSLPSPIISKAHARISRTGDFITIEDLGSTNGTYVNGERVRQRALSASDRAIVGPFQLEVAEGRLRILDTRRRSDVAAHGLAVTADGRLILDHVSVSLRPGTLTAIIGPSGSGKSTLLQALSGARRLSEGRVRVNGVDLYEAVEALRGSIGYVPQDDIVHTELTPAESLDYTARLRLPPDTKAEERARRVAEVLATLELTERQNVPIHRLSGGQRKRVSIAVELLTEPDLLFLDEPAAGLDPGLEESLMLLLRELAFKGKTVVIVTHTLDHIHFCDALVLLVAGRKAYEGPPDGARRQFGIAHLAQLYTKLKERPGHEWAPSQPPAPPPLVAPAAFALPHSAPRSGGARALAVLASRYFRTLTRDRRNAVLLLLQAPLVAVLIGLSLLYGASDVGYTKPKNTLLFLLSLTAVWFGCSNAARELVKERKVFLRERMVGLPLVPYVLSKLLVLSGLALLQCLAFLVILDLWFGIPGRGVWLLGAMLLAATIGLLLGLLISATARTADRAMTLLPIVLIPQVLFTFPAVQLDMKGPAGVIAKAMPTWWSYDLLRRIALEPDASLPDEALDARLAAGRAVLMTRTRFESMLQQGFAMWGYRNTVEITWTARSPEVLGQRLPTSLGHWRPAAVDLAALGGMGMLLLALTLRRQSRAGP